MQTLWKGVSEKKRKKKEEEEEEEDQNERDGKMFCDDLDESVDTRVVGAGNVGDGLWFDAEMGEIV